MDDGTITGLKTNESWVSCVKLKKIQIVRACGRAFQSLGSEFGKSMKPNYFWHGFHPHLEYKGKTEKMIEEIVAVHSEESALEDIAQLCHWNNCTPVKKKKVVSTILHRKPVEFFFFFKTGLMCSLFFVSVTVLAAVVCTNRKRRSYRLGSHHKQLLR